MAVIRDVMPAFQLLQPTSIADAQKLLEQQGPDGMVLAGGMVFGVGPLRTRAFRLSARTAADGRLALVRSFHRGSSYLHCYLSNWRG